jgi:hypothetical protein
MRGWLSLILLGAALIAGACGDDSGSGDGDGEGSSDASGDGDAAGDGDGDGDGSSGDGDGDAPSPGNVDSGLDPDMAATEVSADDAASICEAFEASVAENEIEIDCTSAAVMDTEDEAACIERRDDCIEVESKRDGANDGCHGEAIAEGLSSCDADVTVGEIEDCLNELFAWEASLTCADAGSATGPSCFDQLLVDCPNLFDGEDGDGGDGDAGDGDGDAGDGDGSAMECPEDARSAEGIDCERWCEPLANVGCDNGPTMQECVFICEESKTACPGLAGALAGCQQAEQASWECDGSDPDLTACGLELLCYGDCVDMITSE